MKTETQIKLEKEVEKLRSMCASVDIKKLDMKEVSKLNCYIEIFVQQAKLLQHKIDIKNFERLVDKENIYPTDIFPEIHEGLLEEVNQELQSKFEFPLDRLSAQVCRKILDNQKEALKEL